MTTTSTPNSVHIPENARIVVAGAGSIGCFVGGLLVAQGHQVCLLGRPRIIDAIRNGGLKLADGEALDMALDANQIGLSTSPECLADADIIILAAKSLVTEEIAEEIARYAPAHAIVMSLQNGVRNPRILREKLQQTVVATMIPFNVVLSEGNRFQRTTFTAEIIMEWQPELAKLLSGDLITFTAQQDFNEVAWGKLLLNINNAINALGGLPVRQQLMDPQWRRLMAHVVEESMRVMAAAGIKHQSVAPVSMKMFCWILRLPTWLFQRIANSMLKVDPEARASMWEDLQQKRLTEIDEFQGLIIELAEENNCSADLNRRIYGLIKKAEQAAAGSPGLSVDAIRNA
ncbi:2-dehydropantoate 2-reductase [Pseudoteredinibacter isoporae]|uniref:2-dehydropantoate 2-reductase n=1 Tax=Pseudoteredinibacter isoporae TaxID=570281 RepID=A0A7X0MXL3_9GAMM|nr:2-dehydropantoate 2-reductase [Pseudoteredinibacter isoporae]MBB6522109.1 2-dehydropantoate 2-reductase [Pseudoteredinibacter isoporae]NHO87644.1 2-dehydropantoate 2-reductase [Pseudoteredinibacter isoporae]NIB24025.1 2-dehydropantoate 2-reductase [Pseudoteredinibacter isoporae]